MCLSQFARTFALHVFVFTITLYLVILPMILKDKPHSFYYGKLSNVGSLEETMLHENDIRKYEASLAITRMNDTRFLHPNSTWIRNTQHKPIISIVVVTVSRDGVVRGDSYSPKYLTQVTAKFLTLIQELPEDYPLQVEYHLCVTNSSGYHPEADSLRKYVRVYTMPHSSQERSWAFKEKHKRGYVFCLNHTANPNAAYVMMVEDDSIPHDNLFDVLREITQRYGTLRSTDDRQGLDVKGLSLEHVRFGTFQKKSTVFFKLYHPQRLLGFLALDQERLPELLASSSCTACLLLTVYYFVQVRHQKNILENIGKVYMTLFIICLIAYILVGRVHLIEFRCLLSPHLYYLTPSPSCCTPAIVYPRHSIAPIVQYLDNITCSHLYMDHALDSYISQPDKHAYLVQPNVFDHVGMYSAQKRRKIKSQLLV